MRSYAHFTTPGGNRVLNDGPATAVTVLEVANLALSSKPQYIESLQGTFALNYATTNTSLRAINETMAFQDVKTSDIPEQYACKDQFARFVSIGRYPKHIPAGRLKSLGTLGRLIVRIFFPEYQKALYAQQTHEEVLKLFDSNKEYVRLETPPESESPKGSRSLRSVDNPQLSQPTEAFTPDFAFETEEFRALIQRTADALVDSRIQRMKNIEDAERFIGITYNCPECGSSGKQNMTRTDLASHLDVVHSISIDDQIHELDKGRCLPSEKRLFV